MLRGQGTWTGPSAPDGVLRVHAFRRLRDQELTVVIGIGQEEAMHAAGLWKANACLAGAAVSAILLLLAYLLLREVRAARGREQRLSQDRRTVERAYEDLAVAKTIAEAKTAQLETTLAGMSDGVMVLDSELRLSQWNDRFSDCTGVPRNLVVSGQPMAALLRGQVMAGEFGTFPDPVEMEHEVRRRLKVLRDESGTVLIERTRPDGSTLELRRTRLPGGGMVTLYTDVTARKRAADAQAAARALADEAIAQKSRFVAIVSHEIRTPLNAVVNSLALLDVAGLSTAQRKLAGTAREAGDALMDLVSDILELSKAEAGELAVRSVDYELRPLLDGVSDMFRAEAARNGMNILVDVHAAVPRHLRGDAGRLRQVMINLVSNAIKFSQPGNLRIAAETVLTEAGWMLVLAVQDNGQPIGEAEAVHLFQPFSRLDNARDAGTPGTGLGLAICDRLAQLMRGSIGLRRAPQGGNEFWLAVPLVAGVPLSQLPPDVVPVIRQRRMIVLLVEDIPANHLVTATLLRREGHRVDVAESGAAAVRMAQMQPYDLIFMDLIMPSMSGFEAARQIRARPGIAGRVPIIALTATTAPEDRARCLAAGMTDMLGKPVRPQEMMAVLARLEHRPDIVPPVSDKPVLEPMMDMERLADLRQGLAPATLLSLVNQCLDDMHRRMPLLRDSISTGTYVDIEMAAHALAGMAGSYGLCGMDRCMRRIIAAGRAADRSAVEAAALTMEDDLAEAAEALRRYLGFVPA